MTEDRIGVRKTLKLFIGGAFPRSESGRSYAVTTDEGAFLANASQASRKDARDAVLAARAAVSPWTKATAYNRGQILYRIAEVMEGRRSQFVEEVGQAEGAAAAAEQVDAAIDRVVWYAGWADKFAQVLGSSNPVAGPYFDFSVPEPTGVVAAIAPPHSSLLGLVSVVAPIIVTGNTVIVIASQAFPAPAIAWAEVLATSDLPAGVVNILTGDPVEIAPWLASHADVNALDLSGIDSQDLVRDLQIAAADTVKRVHRWPMQPSDLQAPPGVARLTAFVETKTVWHPMGV
jgi:acyl-CoA reductase-like NAD-dependent aldehyde dehydrogenase